ncbi:MAG: hypothetical protein R6U43_00095 [Candidatus Krumholzibacteriales bacterium]
MSKKRFLIIIFGLLYIAGISGSCSDNVLTGEKKENIRPTIRITNAPLERAETTYRIHIYWDASDRDGKVRYSEYCIVSGDPYGFSPSDTTGPDKWTKTLDEDTREVYHDKWFAFECDSISYNIEIGEEEYTRSEKTQTFFIRAIDWEGGVSEVAHVSFNSWTLAPKTQITSPDITGYDSFSTVITFEWKGTDYVDSEKNTQPPDSVRYMIQNISDLDIPPDAPPSWRDRPYRFMDDLMNKYPLVFNKYYKKKHGGSGWIEYATSDTGSTTKIGDDEFLDPNAPEPYVFAVQAKDEAGAITSIMRQATGGNVVCFTVSPKNPVLRVTERTTGSAIFVGERAAKAAQSQIPPGIELRFSWTANTSEYGGQISAFRYGWDIVNLDDPDEWDSQWGKDVKGSVKTYYSSTHTLNVQVRDDGEHITTGLINVQVIDFNMNRPLLLVDDWGLGSSDYNGQIPNEAEHDAYLQNMIGNKVEEFGENPRDIFDTRVNTNRIAIEDLANYKNMIWVFGDQEGSWLENITFIPESAAGGAGGSRVNLIKLFLRAGGHVLTYGQAGYSTGGLGDCFSAIQGLELRYPRAISQDIVADAYGWDESWKNAMAYSDYGVDVLHRIEFKISTKNLNAMRLAYLDPDEPANATYPGLPDTLRIKESISSSGAFWDHEYWSSRGDFSRCGLWYVETYNDRDHMEKLGAYRVPDWFHPMYRMRSCKAISDFDFAPVAMILTKNADVQALAEGTIAANSFHFGFPLWYMSDESVNDILDVIFTEWGIKDK